MHRNYNNTATEYPIHGSDAARTIIHLSPFGQAVTEAGADFVRALFSQFVLLIAGLLLMLAKEQAWHPGVALWTFRISCLPWILLAGRILLRTIEPFAQALAEIITRRDLNHSGQVGDLPPPPLLESPFIPGTRVYRSDFVFFVNEIVAKHRWSQSAWRGRRDLPGVQQVDNKYWKGMIVLVQSYGALIGHGDRRTGQLLISDATTFLDSIDLDNPPPLRPEFPAELRAEPQFSSV